MNDQNVYANHEVQEVIRLHQDLFTDEFCRLPVREQLARQAQRIVEAHKSGNKAAATHVTCWHPELVGHSEQQIMERELTLDDARETIAREYGFDDWSDVERRGSEPPIPEFEAAVDALLAGDVDRLRTLVEHLFRDKAAETQPGKLLAEAEEAICANDQIQAAAAVLCYSCIAPGIRSVLDVFFLIVLLGDGLQRLSP